MNQRNKIVVISTVLVSILALFFLINKLSNKGTYSAGTLPSVTLSCTPNKVLALGETDCDIVLDTAGKTILGVSANYIKNNQVNYVSYSDYCSSSECFQTIASTTNGFATGNLTGASGNSIIIGKVKVNMTDGATPGNSYSIGLSNIELSDDEYNLIQISGNVTTSVSVKSNDATLKSLTVSAGTLSPAFASGTTTYIVSVPYSTSTITITGVANASTAVVTGNVSNKALSVGENIINIMVTAEDGTTKKTYTINVTVDTKYVLLKFHLNGGSLATEHSDRIGVNNGYVTLDNEYLVTSIAYGNSLGVAGLVNYNNSTYLNIEKNGYAAKSKAEWNTEPDGTGTSYSQSKVYSSDDFCDASNGICEVTLYVNWVPNNIEAVLDIDNSIIKSITAGTTLSNIMSNIQTTDTIVLYDKSGNIKQNSETLKTGDYITVTSNGTSASYYLSVLGDVNGDGNVTVVDVAKLFQHYRRTNIIPENERYYIIAGDTVTDDVIKLTDVAKLFQYVRGTIPNLE